MQIMISGLCFKMAWVVLTFFFKGMDDLLEWNLQDP